MAETIGSIRASSRSTTNDSYPRRWISELISSRLRNAPLWGEASAVV
jgi:hypothetical protein